MKNGKKIFSEDDKIKDIVRKFDVGGEELFAQYLGEPKTATIDGKNICKEKDLPDIQFIIIFFH